MLTKEQLELRQTGIGASEISALVGLHPYLSPMDVWLSKVKGESPPQNAAMEQGNFLEPGVAAWYAHRTGAKLTPGTTCRMADTIALATPDYLINGPLPGVLEIKVPNSRTWRRWGDAGTDEVPPEVHGQVQWQMMVLGLPSAIVAAPIAGDLSIYVIAEDRGLQESMLQAAEWFWAKHVKTGVPPPPDGSRAWTEHLAKAYPPQSAHELLRPATSYAEALAHELEVACRANAATAARVETAKQALKDFIGDARGVEGTFGKITWSPVAGRPAWKAIATEAGASKELIAKHTTKSAGKQLRHPFHDKDES